MINLAQNEIKLPTTCSSQYNNIDVDTCKGPNS